MIVRFVEKEGNGVRGLLIQKNNNYYYGYIFDMNIEEINYGMNSPQLNNNTLSGLIIDFMEFYNNKLEAFQIQPIIGEGEDTEELAKILNQYSKK